MFCPKCATQNVDGASYCRHCGANVSLVPQALNGDLPREPQRDDQYPGRRAPSMERAIRRLMMGVAFAVMIALATMFAPGKMNWQFWMIVPAMFMFGRGFVELARVHGARNRFEMTSPPHLNSVRQTELAAVKTGELMTAVPSVTESTTRLLETEARTKQL